jgi:predicted DNA binding CopG/RHH family protein
MSIRSKSSAQLPLGLSPAEEAQWWDEHRDYWETSDSADEVVKLTVVRRTKPVNLRLPVDMIEELKTTASRRALPYQTLIRMWLREKLDAEAS